MTIATPEKTATGVLVRPLSPNLGAVIEGVDGSRPLTSDVVDELRRAILAYKVLFFRGQNLDPDTQAVSAHFGDPFDGVHAGRFAQTRGGGSHGGDCRASLSCRPPCHGRGPVVLDSPDDRTPRGRRGHDVGGSGYSGSLTTLERHVGGPHRPKTSCRTTTFPTLISPRCTSASTTRTLTPEQIAERRYDLRPHNHPVVRHPRDRNKELLGEPASTPKRSMN